MSYTDKNPERVAAGLKAAVHNPSVSNEAKDRARERLHEMNVEIDEPASSHHAKKAHGHGHDTAQTHTAGHGHAKKASVDKDVRASRSATKEAEAAAEQEGEHRVLGGYKATLKNPHVSEEAKAHAREVLEEHDAL